MLCKNKALAKKILKHHRIRTANFEVYERGKRFHAPRNVRFPMMVKPVREEASNGIAQASLVDSPETLSRRVLYIHEVLKQDALVEEYIHGRELYVSVMGHRTLEVLPVREMKFRDVPEGEARIATFKAKWNPKYRKRWGINEEFADPLPKGVVERVKRLCRKAYRVLQMDGYGRMDLRLTAEGDVVFLEANPNPFLAPGEDFAESAKKAGYPFDVLLERLLQLALHRPAA
jgi:D-alanine-D-alanine ligase